MTAMEVWFASSFREEIMPFLAKLVLKSDEEVSIIENEVNMYANKDVAQTVLSRKTHRKAASFLRM